MIAKMKKAIASTGRESLFFFCPGCEIYHSFIVKVGEPGDPLWQWNGDMERPTFSPSLGVNLRTPGALRCHSFVRDGKIQFLTDSEHALAGQTVDIPDHEWGDW